MSLIHGPSEIIYLAIGILGVLVFGIAFFINRKNKKDSSSFNNLLYFMIIVSIIIFTILWIINGMGNIN